MANALTSLVTYPLQVWGWAWLSGWGCLGKMEGVIKGTHALHFARAGISHETQDILSPSSKRTQG